MRPSAVRYQSYLIETRHADGTRVLVDQLLQGIRHRSVSSPDHHLPPLLLTRLVRSELLDDRVGSGRDKFLIAGRPWKDQAACGANVPERDEVLSRGGIDDNESPRTPTIS